MAIQVVLKGGEWRGLTDGKVLYWVPNAESTETKDIRKCGFPPKTLVEGFVAGKEDGRVGRYMLPTNGLNEIVNNSGLTIKHSPLFALTTQKIETYSAVAGGLGAFAVIFYIGWPPSFAWIAAYFGGMAGYFTSFGILRILFGPSEFDRNTLAMCFLDTTQKFLVWDSYYADFPRMIQEFNERKAAEAKKYLEQAQVRWNEYISFRELKDIDSLNGFVFEEKVAKLYSRLGYKTKLTPKSGDYGVDVVARLGNVTIAIQAKRYKGAVGIDAVNQVVGGKPRYEATEAIVITSAYFTQQAKEQAHSNNVTLIDRAKLIEMWRRAFGGVNYSEFTLEKYEQLKPEIDEILTKFSPANNSSSKMRKRTWRGGRRWYRR